MKALSIFLAAVAFAAAVSAQSKSSTGADEGVESLLEVRRIYVGQLSGGAQATALRDLIIASLDATKLFVLTDKEERADAVLKGAADDKTFTDTFDTYSGVSGHDSLGKSASGASVAARASGITGGNGISENDSHHSRERKHEAYASVRLCNKDGDVLWSTTQESLGGKFRGASADVAAKIAHQITLDYDRLQRADASAAITAPSTAAKP
jgi:hypothetical protein